MADLCEVTRQDIVIDPACGTGGFLIACLQRVHEVSHLKYEDVVKIVKSNLIGYGRKLTPSRICSFSMKRMPMLETWVEAKINHWRGVIDGALGGYA